MRLKIDNQGRLNFESIQFDSFQKVTAEWMQKYEAIANILDANPRILDAVHRDLAEPLDKEGRNSRKRGRPFQYTSETVLRLAIVQTFESLDYRGLAIRVEDGMYLRQWAKLPLNEPMMSYSVFCRLLKKISNESWAKINAMLAKFAVANNKIKGDRLRLDTTAVETNIHKPHDAAQLSDTYRVLARLVQNARDLDPNISTPGNIQKRTVKRLYLEIIRPSKNKEEKEKKGESSLVQAYRALIGHVKTIFDISESVRQDLIRGLDKGRYDIIRMAKAMAIIEKIQNFRALGERVVDQTERRVFNGENVPATEKVYSIFESHTDMIIRGKMDKDIEFGHQIQLHQVGGKFITGYNVFDKNQPDNTLVDDALKNHTKLFGHLPTVFAADKGYYENMDKIRELEQDIKVVSIGKKGKRNAEEDARESSPAFKAGQAFRAGIEGTISLLKRAFRLLRCFRKGWMNFQAEVGRAVFVHNLLVLARASS